MGEGNNEEERCRRFFGDPSFSHCLAVLVKSGGGMINEFSNTEESNGQGCMVPSSERAVL